jgi:hypothetical protein
MDNQSTAGTRVLSDDTQPSNQARFNFALQGEDGSPASFTPATHQANSTATDVAGVVTDLNALLAKLQAAGLMA